MNAISVSTKVLSVPADVQGMTTPVKRPVQSDMIAIYLPGREVPLRFKGKNEITNKRNQFPTTLWHRLTGCTIGLDRHIGPGTESASGARDNDGAHVIVILNLP